jgi:hypothetical protein
VLSFLCRRDIPAVQSVWMACRRVTAAVISPAQGQFLARRAEVENRHSRSRFGFPAAGLAGHYERLHLEVC